MKNIIKEVQVKLLHVLLALGALAITIVPTAYVAVEQYGKVQSLGLPVNLYFYLDILAFASLPGIFAFMAYIFTVATVMPAWNKETRAEEEQNHKEYQDYLKRLEEETAEPVRIKYVKQINDSSELAGFYDSRTKEIYVARVGVEGIMKDYGITEDQAFDIIAIHELMHLKHDHQFFIDMSPELRFKYEFEAWFSGRKEIKKNTPELSEIFDIEHRNMLKQYGYGIESSATYRMAMRFFDTAVTA